MPHMSHKRSSIQYGRIAVALFAAFAAGAASAEDAPKAYEMIVIGDVADGWLIKQGKFEQAIDKAEKRRVQPDQFELANNLCVAYTLAKDFDNASRACDDAVPASEKSMDKAKTNPLINSSVAERAEARYGAIAYSNRGVLRAMTGDSDGAREDFESATLLGTSVEAPERNLEKLVAANTR